MTSEAFKIPDFLYFSCGVTKQLLLYFLVFHSYSIQQDKTPVFFPPFVFLFLRLKEVQRCIQCSGIAMFRPGKKYLVACIHLHGWFRWSFEHEMVSSWWDAVFIPPLPSACTGKGPAALLGGGGAATAMVSVTLQLMSVSSIVTISGVFYLLFHSKV